MSIARQDDQGVSDDLGGAAGERKAERPVESVLADKVHTLSAFDLARVNYNVSRVLQNQTNSIA